MNLITPLIAGIRGAENGSAELFKRGTSNHATWYGSFEADAPDSSGFPITLDAFGGAEVYVDELVDVSVKDSAGTTVRLFTAGDSSPPVEVRSPSFTGADYASAASAAGNPTTLQAVLDLWLQTNGAIDWNVSFNGSSSTIKAALSMLNGKLFFNVKDDAFGARGDGSTNDTSAIQAALTAAGAVGGVVLFPPGTYKVTAALNVPSNTHLVGMGTPATVILTIDHATANLLVYADATDLTQYIINLTLSAAQTNTGRMLNMADVSRVTAVDCAIGDFNNSTGDLVVAAFFKAEGCAFQMVGSGRAIVDAFSIDDIRLVDCSFTCPASAYSPTTGMIIARRLYMDHCRFEMLGMTSGAAQGIAPATVGSSINLHVENCYITAPTGGTVHLFNFSAASITHLTQIYEDYNVAFGSAALYLMNATPFTGDATAAANPGTQSWNCHFGSRERRLIKVTHNGTPYDLNTMEYGLILLERTDATPQTLTANAAVPNGKFSLFVHNNNGGSGGAITLSTGFYPGEAFTITTTQLWHARTHRGLDMLGTMRWISDATARNNI